MALIRPKKNRTYRFNTHSLTLEDQPSYQVIKLSSYQVIKLSSYQVIKLSSYQVIKLSSYQDLYKF